MSAAAQSTAAMSAAAQSPRHATRRGRSGRRRCGSSAGIDLRAGVSAGAANGSVRTLHVVDVENVMCGQHESAGVHEIAAALEAYDCSVGARFDDLTFYGVNPALQFRVHEATTRGRVVGRSGPDGADDGLLDMVTADWVVERFDRVCIASGDHAFAPLAAELRCAGLHVVVACAPGRLSADLYRASSEHVTLSAPRAPQLTP